MLKLARHVFIAALLLRPVAFADLASDTPQPATSFVAGATISSVPSVSTCRSRTINYITHTLPQQCLRSSWSANIPSTTISDSDAKTSLDRATRTPVAGGEDAEGQTGLSVPSDAASSLQPVSETVIGTATSSSDAVLTSITSPTPEAETETDSPLDNANFLSFEEWKKQNLAKAGQSPENIGQGRASGNQGRKPRPMNINNELDFLGEDAEIELDFGFGSSNKADQAATVSSATGTKAVDEKEPSKEAPASYRPRSKDAGKTCKERFNYASFDCAATVLKTNPQCKSSSSLLVENKDSYMLNECAAQNKFVIVELCDDILVDTVVLANFEFFSSMFRTFRISVSDRYPVKLERWKELGVFEARNSRDIQAFLVENPLIWARYLKIEFLSHYGNEFYCPVSLLRVHGTTMMEEFRHQEEAARGEEDPDEVVETEGQVMQAIQPPHQDQAPVTEGHSHVDTVEPAEVGSGIPNERAEEVPDPTRSSSAQQSATQAADSRPMAERTATLPETVVGVSNISLADNPSTSASGDTSEVVPTSGITPPTSTDHFLQKSMNVEHADNESATTVTASAESLSHSGNVMSESSVDYPSTTNYSPHVIDSKSSQSSIDSGSSTSSRNSQQSADLNRPASSSTQPQSAQPTTQESFFKSIHKRLQMLESNSTLSLQYIEDQSRILRDAFSKVEKRQLGKTEKFLDQLNTTVMAELRGFRQQYDQLWQSTVIELENRREQHEREMLAISTRLTLLADELVFQKRMAVVQSTLILLCLGLVLFVRSGSSYLELPLVHKAQSALRLQFDSPSNSPPPSRHRRNMSSGDGRKRFRIFGSGSLSDMSIDGPRSPTLEFSPPTPTSDEGQDVGSRNGSLGSSPEPLRQTQSGPSTPNGSRDTQASWMGASEGDLRSSTGDRQNLMRRRSPLRSGESVDDFYEDGQSGSSDSRKAGADPNQLGDSGGSGSDSGSISVDDVSD